jgi:uncharacterized protein (DUF433 family)
LIYDKTFPDPGIRRAKENDAMSTKVEIVDHGRGPQLSTSRITVLDLVRYFQKGCAYEEVVRCLSTLSCEEFAAIKRFYLDHKEEFDERYRQACARREEAIRLQRLSFPELNGTREERLARLHDLLEKRRREENGERHPG